MDQYPIKILQKKLRELQREGYVSLSREQLIGAFGLLSDQPTKIAADLAGKQRAMIPCQECGRINWLELYERQTAE